MFITNSTDKKLRFSAMKDKSEDEQYEAFAYVIAKGCSLNISEDDYVISSEEDKA